MLRRARFPAHGKSLLLELTLIGLERALHQSLEIPARQAMTRISIPHFFSLIRTFRAFASASRAIFRMETCCDSFGASNARHARIARDSVLFSPTLRLSRRRTLSNPVKKKRRKNDG